jgi:predicted nucleotidyltransferase
MTEPKFLKRRFPGLIAILKAHKVELAYIFGSVAAGDARPESDVDIAILLPRTFSVSKRLATQLKLAADLNRKFKKDFDVVLLNQVKSLLLAQVIISEGSLIYCANEESLISFETSTMAQYADFKIFLDQYEAHYVAKNS